MIKWLIKIKDLLLGIADELYQAIGFASSSQPVKFFKNASVNMFVSVFLPVAKVIVAEVDNLVLVHGRPIKDTHPDMANFRKRQVAFKRITKAVDKAKMSWKPHLVNLLIEMAVAELKSRRFDG
jgi:hypothetical protein